MTIKQKYVDCFEGCITNFEDGRRTMELAITGINIITTTPKIIEALSNATGQEPKNSKHIQENAEFAKQQIQNGFPLLMTQTLVSLWSFLEASIYDSSIKWLVATKFKTITEELSNEKITFSDFQHYGPAVRAEKLIEAFENKKSRQSSLNKFENLINAIGWVKGGKAYKKFIKSKDVDEKEIAKNLLEFSKVRNLIVHKAGIVDRKFRNDCPWRKDKLDKTIKLNRSDIERYLTASILYLTIIIYRIIDCEEKNGLRKKKTST